MKNMRLGIILVTLLGIVLVAGCTSGANAPADSGKIDASDKGKSTLGDSSESQNTLPGSSQDSDQDSGASISEAPANENFVGKWRIYSEYIYYDTGGSNWLDTPSTRQLELKSGGKWTFGSSTGTWEIKEITEADWANWGVDSYGPTRKMVLNNWNKVGADGPIEETESGVDFIWVIYRAEPPVVQVPGQIQIKFGHAVLN